MAGPSHGLNLTGSFAEDLKNFAPNVLLHRVTEGSGRRSSNGIRYVHHFGRRIGKIAPQTSQLVLQVTDFDHGIVDSSGQYGVHLFGVTREGCPVLLNVKGFNHHIDVSQPEEFSEGDLAPFRSYLQGILGDGSVARVARYRRVRDGLELGQFIRVEVHHPSSIPKLRDVFTGGRCRYRDGIFGSLDSNSIPSHDSYTMQFITDTKIKPLTWLRVHPGKYTLTRGSQRISTCRLEASVHYGDIKLLDHAKASLPDVAPLRVLSFDIETMVPLWRDSFCHPNSDRVLQIGCIVSCVKCMALTGENTLAADPFYRCIFTLKTCADIEGCDVFSFETERDMLNEWRRFVVDIDPDVVTGYNSLCFDLPYLLVRAQAVGLTDFGKLGRLKGKASQYDVEGYRKAKEEKFKYGPSMPGRLHIDVYHWVFKNVPAGELGSGAHRLDNIAFQYLEQRKENIDYKDIPKMQEGPEASEHTRRTLAVYCMKDTYLAMRLYTKLNCMEYYSSLAREHGVPINWLLTGQRLVQVI